MDNYYFYTIMIDNKFINSNVLKKPDNNINQAIRFETYEEAEEHCKLIKKDIDFKIIKVECNLKEV